MLDHIFNEIEIIAELCLNFGISCSNFTCSVYYQTTTVFIAIADRQGKIMEKRIKILELCILLQQVLKPVCFNIFPVLFQRFDKQVLLIFERGINRELVYTHFLFKEPYRSGLIAIVPKNLHGFFKNIILGEFFISGHT